MAGINSRDVLLVISSMLFIIFVLGLAQTEGTADEPIIIG